MNEQDSSVRVAGIGASAGGIAHDFNNILNIIQGYASVLGESAGSEQIAESREAVLETAQRRAALVKQLLTLARKTEVKAERYICIEVGDTGTGMSDNMQRRIFEPFFTTKDNDKGSGLGLAVAYGIVKHHEGFIEVRSQPGEGATVRLYLPASASGEQG